MLNSMRAKVTAIAVLATAIALTLAAIALHTLVARSLLQEIDSFLINRSLDVVDGIETTNQLDNASFPGDDATFLGILVIEEDGTVVLDPHNDDEPDAAEVANLLSDPELPNPGNIDFDTPTDASLPSLDLVEGDTNLRLVATPVPSGAEIVVVARSLDGLDRTVRQVDTFSLVSVPTLTALVGLLVWMLTGRALKPVERMRKDVESITASDLRRRVSESGQSTEIDALGETMNNMLARLEESRERERSFASDAAHELRSPLASMAAQLDVDQAHPDQADAQRTANALRHETTRLQGLVEDLLLLARSEQPDATSHRLVDMDDVLAVSSSAISLPHTVQLTLPPVTATEVRANERELQRLITNLLTNAARHATSRIEVTVGESAEGITIGVHDDGAGIPEGDRRRVFERFTRLDEARTRDAGGSGLGLALVQGIAKSHRGRVELTSSHLGGALFTVILPKP